MRRFLARSTNLLRRDHAGREMLREIESHLALIAEDLERQGIAPEDARLAAKRTYGGVEQSKELHREARSFLWIEEMLRDIRYGIRNLLRSPGFTITAVAALTLGIGANTAIFSIVNAVLLKPLPVPDLERLVTVVTTFAGDGGQSQTNPTASPAMFAFWRAQSNVFAAMTAITDADSVMNYSGGDVLEQTLALIGTMVGAGASWALARSLENLLFGVKARDPLVFVAAPLVLGAVALLAGWIPARRAVRVNPVEALRYE